LIEASFQSYTRLSKIKRRERVSAEEVMKLTWSLIDSDVGGSVITEVAIIGTVNVSTHFLVVCFLFSLVDLICLVVYLFNCLKKLIKGFSK